MRHTSPMRALPSSLQSDLRSFIALRMLCMAGVLCFGFLSLGAQTVQAIPISQYQNQIRQAVTALDTLTLRDETEDVAAYEQRSLETVKGLRNLIPETLVIEWRSEKFNVDNSWLHQELNKYGTVIKGERPELLLRITERLQALDQRLTELQTPGANNPDKAETSRKLAEILRRPEFAYEVTKENALVRLLKRFLDWLRNLFPKPKPMSMGRITWLSRIAQFVVVVLALAVLAYVVKLFLPRMLRNGSSKKKNTKQKARIVLGERLEPDQSASDLLSAAEALARRGELRGAIRKAYIALLVELGERKIISLAQYKTNRDYLRAVREVQPLHRDMKKLTERFEQHWYGLAQATENDWLEFRAGYIQTLSR